MHGYDEAPNRDGDVPEPTGARHGSDQETGA